MQHRQLVSNTSCPRCGGRTETIDHIFCECPWSLISFPHVNAAFSVVHFGPSIEFIKIDFDGVYDGSHHQSASSIVVKNEEGIVLLSC